MSVFGVLFYSGPPASRHCNGSHQRLSRRLERRLPLHQDIPTSLRFRRPHLQQPLRAGLQKPVPEEAEPRRTTRGQRGPMRGWLLAARLTLGADSLMLKVCLRFDSFRRRNLSLGVKNLVTLAGFS